MQDVGETWPRLCRFWPQQSARGSSNATHRPASATRTWNPSWSISASCTLTSRGPRSPRHRVRQHRNRQHHTFPATVPSFPAAAGGRVDAGASSSGAGGPVHGFSCHHPAAQPVGATPVAEGGERVQAKPQLVSQQQPQQQLSTQSVLDIPNAQFTPTQHQSASPGTARFCVSSPAVAMPESRTSAVP